MLSVYVIRGIVELINLSVYASDVLGRSEPSRTYLLLFSLAGSLVCCILGVKAIIAMVMRHHSFRFLFILYSVVPLFFGSIVIFSIPPVLHVQPVSSEITLVLDAAFAVVWVPYVVRSRRVENTFVKAGSRGGFGETMIRHFGMPRFLGLFIVLTLIGSVAFGWLHKPLWLIVPPFVLAAAALQTSAYTAARMGESGIPTTSDYWSGAIAKAVVFALRNTMINAVAFGIVWLVAAWV